MTRTELQIGLRRLGIATIVLIGVALAMSWLFALSGAPARNAIAGGTGSIGILLVLCGIGAFVRARPTSARHRRALDARAPIDNRDVERLALGLFAYGITFSVVALAVG